MTQLCREKCGEEELTDGASSCHIIIDENVTLIKKVNVHPSYIWFSVFNYLPIINVII